MLEKVTAYIRQHHMIQQGDHICVGVSGGADSVCLFLILESLREMFGFSMSVVHIEHGIRGKESVKDMEFVKQLGKKYQIPVATYSYPVQEISREQKISVEEAGRNARYEAFGKEVSAYGEKGKIALAHHGDDNAETMLFHMCRGSGIEGMAGIRPVRGNVIRPLLSVTRKEIEEFLATRKQTYRTDATNESLIYSRNRIRNGIMPELIKLNEQAVSHMNLLGNDLLEISEYIQSQVETILKAHKESYGSTEIGFLTDGMEHYPLFLQRRVMLELIAEVAGKRKDIGREHTKALLDLANGQVGRQISLPYGVLAEKTYGKMLLYKERCERGKAESYFLKISEENMPDMNVWREKELSGWKIRYRVLDKMENTLEFPKNQYTKWFDYDKINGSLCVRNREQGDYLVVDAAGHEKKIKEYFINEKIPKAEREQVLLLADGSHVLWVIGHRISEYYKITQETTRILEIQFMEEV